MRCVAALAVLPAAPTRWHAAVVPPHPDLPSPPPPPPPPLHPPAFFPQRVDLRRNHTESSDQSFSVSNLASECGRLARRALRGRQPARACSASTPLPPRPPSLPPPTARRPHRAAVLDDFHRFNTTAIALTDYKAPGIRYDVFDGQRGPECRESPVREQMPIPPVQNFLYNGTITLRDGTKAYRYTEPQNRDQDYLTTADANQYPVAFYDRRDETALEFRNFKAQTTWPAGTFAKPAGCQ